MGKIKEALLYIENEFSPTERETTAKIANQLLENPGLYVKKFKKNKGTKNDERPSDTSMAIFVLMEARNSQIWMV